MTSIFFPLNFGPIDVIRAHSFLRKFSTCRTDDEAARAAVEIARVQDGKREKSIFVCLMSFRVIFIRKQELVIIICLVERIKHAVFVRKVNGMCK